MIKFFVLLILSIIYIIGGVVLEKYFGYKAPAGFAFYGYVFGVLTTTVMNVMRN